MRAILEAEREAATRTLTRVNRELDATKADLASRLLECETSEADLRTARASLDQQAAAAKSSRHRPPTPCELSGRRAGGKRSRQWRSIACGRKLQKRTEHLKAQAMHL